MLLVETKYKLLKMNLHLIFAFIHFVACKGLSQVLQVPTSNVQDSNFDEKSLYRLPTNLKPVFYNLTLGPLSTTTFKGSVRIIFDVERETDSIVLNVKNENILTSSWKVVLYSEMQELEITETVVDGAHEMVTFKLNEFLIKQKGVVLTISYNARYDPMRMYTNGQGFYRINYDDDTQDNLVISKFEPVYARRAFPCFDDPRYRSRFQLAVYRLPEQVSLFNTPLISSVPSSQPPWIIDTYEPSPPMPSYLVAFGVTNLANISDGGQVRLFARQTDLASMALALSVAQPVLDAMAAYTGVPYPMPKMDMVAEKAKMGAMENWALVTFGERRIIYNQSLASPYQKFSVVRIIAHEFAHQWFGGLVTMESWEYLWLNEAFATYLAFVITQEMYPDWKLPKDEAVSSLVSFPLNLDIGTPRAMSSPVPGFGNERSYFDYVSYGKGGGVLRMTENFLTTSVWKKGLKIYLTKNQFSTVNPEKLFSALQEAANEIGLYTVNETMQGWTHNPGYPLITVTQDSVTADGKVRYRITQTPYKLDDKSANYKWNVPLAYTTDKKREFDPSKSDKHWLYPSDPSTSELVVDTDGWVLFNVDRIGLYRVNYDAENWRKLKQQLMLDMTVIPEVSRVQLVDDALSMAQSGFLDTDTTLDFLKFLVFETAYGPWEILRRAQYRMADEEDVQKKEIFEAIRALYNSSFNPTLQQNEL